MTLLNLLLMLAVICIVGYAAYWIITKFFAPPLQMPALAIVGLILLFFLLVQFFPEAGSYRVWK
jgi:hypothetical protein